MSVVETVADAVWSALASVGSYTSAVTTRMAVFDSAWQNALLWYSAALLLSLVWKRLRAPGLDLRGKHVFVTGGSSGLGLALAEECVRRGARTVTIVARNRQRLEAARKQIVACSDAAADEDNRDQQVLAIAADVTNADELRAAVEESEKAHYSAVDYLFCCAGFAKPGYFEEHGPGVFQRQMDVNYMGSVNAIFAVLPSMSSKRRGHIVLVGSAMSTLAFVGYSQYAPSKWAVRALADSLRNEFKRHNVQVSLYLPSTIDSPGLVEEEKTKPAETRALEDGGVTSKPEVCVQNMLGGLARGDYMTTDEVMIEVQRMLLNGTNPRNLTLLELPLLPLLGIVQFGFYKYVDWLIQPVPRKRKSN